MLYGFYNLTLLKAEVKYKPIKTQITNDRQINKARDRLRKIRVATQPRTRPPLVRNHEHETDCKSSKINVIQFIHKQTRLLLKTAPRRTQPLQRQSQQMREQSKRTLEEDKADPESQQGSEESKQYTKLRESSCTVRRTEDDKRVDHKVSEIESRYD